VLVTSNLLLLLLRLVPSFLLFLPLVFLANLVVVEALSKALFMGKEGGREGGRDGGREGRRDGESKGKRHKREGCVFEE
jgi:hypothetical protein